MTSFDPVQRPAHYAEGRRHEPAEVILDWKLPWTLGNTVKYISRAGRKGGHDEYSRICAAVEDLEKARWYLNKELDVLTQQKVALTPGLARDPARSSQPAQDHNPARTRVP